MKNILLKIKSYFSSIFYLAFPHHCYLCDKKIIDENQICKKCSESLPNFQIIEINRPENIQRYFNKIYSVWNYTPEFQLIIEKIKFKKKLKLLKVILENNHFNFPENFDMISFVPLTFQSYVERGFNQSKKIAARISRLLKIPLIHLFGKKTFTKQSWKNKKERLGMIENSPFYLKKKYLLEGKKVLIVDDIITTGATLASLALLLKQKGAEIYAFSLIHVEKEENIPLSPENS